MITRREFLSRTSAAGIVAVAPTRFAHAAAAYLRKDEPKIVRAGEAETVLGPLDALQLGFTLPHEHIADAPYVLSRWPKGSDGRAELIAKAVDQLKLIRAAGVSTIVDLTTYDVWRDIRFLAEVSRKSGLHMIACTGQRFFPPITHVPMPARTIEGLTEFFKKEIEQGIEGTGIKAGVIKIGIITNNVSALEEIGLRAAVRTSKATGVPIRIHTDA